MIIKQIFIPSICQSNAINAAGDKTCTRKLMTEFYADCIRATVEHGTKSIDWRAVNGAITSRWPKGLTWIKEQAWKVIEGKVKP